MKKRTGFIVITIVAMFMLIATVTAGVIELNRRADLTTVPQDKIEELIGVPIAEQEADATNKGMIEQERIALGLLKDSIIAYTNRCMESQDYTIVQSCLDALSGVFPAEEVIEVSIGEELIAP